MTSQIPYFIFLQPSSALHLRQGICRNDSLRAEVGHGAEVSKMSRKRYRYPIWMILRILLPIRGSFHVADTATSQNDVVCCKESVVENHTDPNPAPRAPRASLAEAPKALVIQASLSTLWILGMVLKEKTACDRSQLIVRQPIISSRF